MNRKKNNRGAGIAVGVALSIMLTFIPSLVGASLIESFPEGIFPGDASLEVDWFENTDGDWVYEYTLTNETNSTWYISDIIVGWGLDEQGDWIAPIGWISDPETGEWIEPTDGDWHGVQPDTGDVAVIGFESGGYDTQVNTEGYLFPTQDLQTFFFIFDEELSSQQMTLTGWDSKGDEGPFGGPITEPENTITLTYPSTPVPEPATILLFGLGMGALWRLYRKKE
jgi:hypothetical protein